jgi:hypothetical protein
MLGFLPTAILMRVTIIPESSIAGYILFEEMMMAIQRYFRM